mmetsp:Transcript_74516/g.129202  ORF Transcript_74516/g.129202 Transcript_74516/m.129202 type:complete len:386 (-) Transcript_74516:159-1316(-)
MRMQPEDHTSAFSVRAPSVLSWHSGDMYRGDPPRFGGRSPSEELLPPATPSPSLGLPMARARPKSHICKCWPSASKTKFMDLRSKWAIGGVRACKYRTPSNSSVESWKRSRRWRRLRRTWSAWCKLPPGASSVTKATHEGSKQAPTKVTKRGWLSSAMTAISARSSAAAWSSCKHSRWCRVLTTTSVCCEPRMVPRWTIANSPQLMHSPMSISENCNNFSGGSLALSSLAAAMDSSERAGWPCALRDKTLVPLAARTPAGAPPVELGPEAGVCSKDARAAESMLCKSRSEASRDGPQLVPAAVDAVPTRVGFLPLLPRSCLLPLSPGLEALSSVTGLAIGTDAFWQAPRTLAAADADTKGRRALAVSGEYATSPRDATDGVDVGA